MGKLKCNLVQYINQYFQFKLKVKLLFRPSTGIFLESLLPVEKRLEEAPSFLIHQAPHPFPSSC